MPGYVPGAEKERESKWVGWGRDVGRKMDG